MSNHTETDTMGRFHAYFPADVLERMDRKRKLLGLSRSAYLRMLVMLNTAEDESTK